MECVKLSDVIGMGCGYVFVLCWDYVEEVEVYCVY